MKRIIAIILVVVLSLTFLTACKNTPKDSTGTSSGISDDIDNNTGNNTTDDDDLLEDEDSAVTGGESSDDTEESSQAPTNSVVTDVEVSDKSEDLYADLKGTTVRVIAFEEPATITKLMIKQFEKKYECKVTVEIYSWADWQVKILEMVAAGNPPDLAVCFDQHFIKYAATDILQPIDSYIDANAPFWDKTILNNYKWKGKTYAVNTEAYDTIMLHYNKNLLENAGLDGAADPYEVYKRGEWTFDKFREYAKALTKQKDGQTEVWGYASWIHDAFVYAAGGRGIVLNKDGTIDITLDKAAEIAGLEMLRKMIHEDKSTSTAAMNSFNALFNAQKVAFMAERPGYAVPDESKHTAFEIGMVPMPKVDKNSKHYNPAITQAWGVPVGAKNPKGAMAYIYYGAVFSDANKNTTYAISQRNKMITDKNLAIYKEAVKSNEKVFSFINGLGNWYDKQWPELWNLIYTENKTAVNAVASAKPIIEYEIEQTLKNK
ncbi:MAG: extracellular solute-binding protein [Ruminococcaceae bacterium]|nr:extracellular solute-binding protein [Oscillospiraceae bacterium]